MAYLYQCKNGIKEINQTVKNNCDKFPERYVFRISEEEFDFLRSKFLTSNIGRGGRTYLPYAFPEQGVVILATILKMN
ncbi:MAG: ORF6N domain-containing protein [Bacilli bacterium]|nr:ORF6N domain-containing protein [Bacilli bacterium]